MRRSVTKRYEAIRDETRRDEKRRGEGRRYGTRRDESRREGTRGAHREQVNWGGMGGKGGVRREEPIFEVRDRDGCLVRYLHGEQLQMVNTGDNGRELRGRRDGGGRGSHLQ